MSPFTQAQRVSRVLDRLESLVKQISPSEVLTITDPSYDLHSEPWAAQDNLHPPVVFAPQSVASLAKILAFLYRTDLDFNVRGHGFKSPSAQDVLISMLKFDGFEYDKVQKLATVGVGETWAQVAQHMERLDPEYSIAVSRTPGIGVGGVILNGGLSWMSTEYGCICDPVNFVDAEVVKYDGSIVWASEEPDLLWALRGSGGGFGLVTRVVLRAHHYPTDIWSGMILIPRTSLPQLARKISEFLEEPQHPKVNFFFYVAPRIIMDTILEPGQGNKAGDIFVLHVYDACGEKHGRKVFDWALEMPGAVDQTMVSNMKGIVDMQKHVSSLRGKMQTYYSPMGLPSLDEATILQAVKWWDDLASVDKAIQDHTMLVFECFIAREPIGGTSLTAWPHSSDFNHLLLAVPTAPADGSPEQSDMARQLAIGAAATILGERAGQAMVNPAGLMDWHHPELTYGEHYDRLTALRKRYDPNARFKALVQAD